MKYLIDQGCPLDTVDRIKTTTLMMAAYAGRHKNVELILEHCNKNLVRARDRDGDIALHGAINNH